jgi:hypothetical protein
MQAHHIKTIIDANGSLHIDALPFPVGEAVDVIVYPTIASRVNGERYPLRNLPVEYIDPFKPTTDADWESAE